MKTIKHPYLNADMELYATGASNWDLYRIVGVKGLEDTLEAMPTEQGKASGAKHSQFGNIGYIESFERRHGCKCGFTRLSDGKQF